MKSVESFGVIPLKKIDGAWHVFLILHKEGLHWGFPKGRANAGESALASAKRELFEETGLIVSKLFTSDSLKENYTFRRFGELYNKTVCYFVAEVEGQVVLQPDEVLDGKWLSFNEADSQLKFAESRALCAIAENIVSYSDLK